MSQTENIPSEAKHSIRVLLGRAFMNLKTLTGKWYILLPLLLVYVVTIVSEPYFYKVFIDSLEKAVQNKESISSVSKHLGTLSLYWISLVLVSLASFTIYDVLVNTFINRDWEISMRKVAAHMFRLPIDYHLKVNLGERQKLVERGNDALWSAAWNIYLQIIPSILIFISLLTLGFYINPILTLISLSILPVGVAISATIGARAHSKQKAVNDLWDSVYGRFTDALVNLSLIRILSKEAAESEILDARMKKAATAQFAIRKLWCFLNAGGKLLALIGKMVVLVAWVFMVLHGTSTIGELFLFVALAGAIYSPLQSLEMSYREMLRSLADYSKLADTLEQNLEEDLGKKTFTGMQKNLVFEGVTFQYPETSREVLKNISFTIPKGKVIAFVGHTGSGKSTLANLLMRFYNPSVWKILVDGEDIRDFTLASYRQRFAAVFQDTTLFNDTIYHNLEYVREDVTRDEILEACKKANILEFIESLPEGFETKVGERWLKLSGGEKQRLAIARAILVDPDFLILDEATSALDAKTEASVKQAFDILMQGRTSVVIAHRLSTIRNADTILLFEKGGCIGSGTHEELYNSSLVYRQMVDYQKDGFIKEEEE